jgi:hypothetical protein
VVMFISVASSAMYIQSIYVASVDNLRGALSACSGKEKIALLP